MTNTLKLKSIMVEKGFTQAELAKALNISEQSLNYKINNKREFKASEITMLIKLLSITNVSEIFFAVKVSKKTLLKTEHLRGISYERINRFSE